MLDREYFERVLPDQLRLMERSAQVTVTVETGIEYQVRSLVAAHDGYVVLEVYSRGQEPEHSRRWQAEHPDAPPDIFDQIAIPYTRISASHVTARTPSRRSKRTLGFHVRPASE